MMFSLNNGRTKEYSSVSPKYYIINVFISQEVYYIQHNIILNSLRACNLFIYLFIEIRQEPTCLDYSY